MAAAVEEAVVELDSSKPSVQPATASTSSCKTTYIETSSSSNDQFLDKESSATAKYIGPGATSSAAAVGDSAGGTEQPHKTEGSITKATHRLVRQDHQIPYNQLLQMLAKLEGELQARDVVIACLRNDRVKSLINHMKTRPDIPSGDPFAALFRDKLAINGNFCSRGSSLVAVQAENEANLIINEQIEILYEMVSRQRQTHNRMVHILTESLENNQRMRQELEEEKRKHEHDTAQGDDITYGLEIERTKLKQELESERNQKKKLEKDVKKLQETVELERNREKQMVLYLMAERKAIIKQYLEEGKRSQDLAQILNEEKQRSDTIAEGLEEESKKSLRFEAELEEQVACFDTERKQLKTNMAKDDRRIKELESEVLLLRNELETCRKKLQQLPQPAGKTRDDGVTMSPMANVAKVVQPTATVSSVPVSGPTTGIARSLSVASGPQSHTPVSGIARLNAAAAASPSSNSQAATGLRNPNVSPPPKVQQQPTTTIVPNTQVVNATGTILRATSVSNATTTTPVAVAATARGQPPPIPPNKPVVPPKREPSISRLNSVAAAAAAAAAASSTPTTTTTTQPITAAAVTTTTAAATATSTATASSSK